MRVPTNTKLERQTNFIQKLIDHNEYFHFLKTSAGLIYFILIRLFNF